MYVTWGSKNYLNNHLYFVPSLAGGIREDCAISAASHKDHDGEVEHDDDCAHEGYHGYDDHDADGHDSECRFIHISECRFSSTLANVATSKLANVATCCTYAFICIVRTSHFLASSSVF